MHCRSMVHISIFLRVWSGPVNTFLMLRFYRSSQICAMSSIQKTGFEWIFITFLLGIQVERQRVRLWVLILNYMCFICRVVLGQTECLQTISSTVTEEQRVLRTSLCIYNVCVCVCVYKHFKKKSLFHFYSLLTPFPLCI